MSIALFRHPSSIILLASSYHTREGVEQCRLNDLTRPYFYFSPHHTSTRAEQMDDLYKTRKGGSMGLDHPSKRKAVSDHENGFQRERKRSLGFWRKNLCFLVLERYPLS